MSKPPSRRTKLTFVFTHHIRWVPFELTAKLINKDIFDVDYVILGASDPMIEFLKANNIPVATTAFNDYKNTPEAVKFVYDHLIKRQSEIVQTHWFAGSLVGLQAAYYAKVPVRIFHREHPPLQYYNRHSPSKHQLIWDCATHFISVTETSKSGMIEDGIASEKIKVIPTGFNVDEFRDIDSARVDRLRSKYLSSKQLKQRQPVIGVAARYVRWKGVEYVIQAFKKVLEKHPNALLILSGTHIDRSEVFHQLASASGDEIVSPQYNDALSIMQCTDTLPEESYIEIPFEEDLYALFRMFDVFVHTPIDGIQETFGQVYVEAMLSRVPSVVTLSGSARDHAVHRENAWVVDYQNSDQIAEGILTLLADHDLRESIVQAAFTCAEESYAINKQIRVLEDFYLHSLNSSRMQSAQWDSPQLNQ
jgi:glycosyltransferase involved in cell wall biosynthesis